MSYPSSLQVWVRCLVGIILLTAAPGLAPSTAQEASDRRRLLQARDRLEQEALRWQESGERAKSLEKVQQMLAAERKLYGGDHDEIAGSLTWIASDLERAGDYRGAVPFAQDAAEMIARLQDPQSEKTIDARMYAERLVHLARCDDQQLRLWQEANRLQAQGAEWVEQRQYDRAVAAALRTVELYRQFWGDGHLEMARAWFNLARVYQQSSEAERALDSAARGYALRRRHLGSGHSQVERDIAYLGDLYTRFIRTLVGRRELSEAMVQLDAWAKALRENYQDDHWELRYVTYWRDEVNGLAQLSPDQLSKYLDCLQTVGQAGELMNSGKLAEAETLLRSVLVDLLQVQGEKHRSHGHASQMLAECLAADKLDEAADILRDVIARYETSFGPEYPPLKSAREKLVSFLQQMVGRQFDAGDLDAVPKISREVLAVCQARYGPDDLQTRNARLNLELTEDYARLPPDRRSLAMSAHQKSYQLPILSNQGRVWDAIDLGEQVVAEHRELFGDKHIEYARSLRTLAALYINIEDHDQAVTRLRESVNIHRNVLGSDHPALLDDVDLLTEQLEQGAQRSRARMDVDAELAQRRELVDRLVELGEEPDWQLRQARAELAETEKRSTLSADDWVRLGEARRREDSSALLLQNGKAAQALPLIEHAVQVHQELLGELCPTYLRSRDHLTDVRSGLGQFELARQDYQYLVTLAKQIYGEVHPEVVSRLRTLATFAEVREEWPLQQESLWEAFLLGRELYGSKHGFTAELKMALEEGLRWGELTADQREAANAAEKTYQSAVAMAGRGDSLAAFDEASRANDQFRKIFGDRWPGYGRLFRLLGNLQHELYHLDEAERSYQLALEHYRQWRADNTRVFVNTLVDLANLYAERKEMAAAERLRRQVVDIELALVDNRSWRVGQARSRWERTERLGRADSVAYPKLQEAARFEEESAAALSRNDLAEGVRLARKAIQVRARLVGVLRDDDLELQRRRNEFAELLVELGQQQLDRHQFDLAQAAFQESLTEFESCYPVGHWRLIRAKYDLAEVELWKKLDPTQLAAVDEARRLQTSFADEDPQTAEQVVSLFTLALGDQHLRTLKAEVNFLQMVQAASGWEATAARLTTIVSRFREILGDENPQTLSLIDSLANVLRSHGSELVDRGEFVQAKSVMQEAVRWQQFLSEGGGSQAKLDQMQLDRIAKLSQLDQPTRDRLAAAGRELDELGRFVKVGDFPAAMRISENWKNISKEVFGSTSLEYAVALDASGNVLFDAGQWDAAAKDLRAGWEICLQTGDWREHQVPATHSLTRVLRSQAQQAVEAEQWKEAVDILRELLVCKQAVFGVEHWILHAEEVAIDDVLTMSKLTAHSKTQLQRANLALQLAQQKIDQGDLNAAIDDLKLAVKYQESVWGTEHHRSAESQRMLADVYYRKGWYDLAEPLYRRAVQACRLAYGRQHIESVLLTGQVGGVYGMLGDLRRANLHFQDAFQACQQAMEISERSPALMDAFTAVCTSYFDVLEHALDQQTPEMVQQSANQIGALCEAAEHLVSVEHPLFVRARLGQARMLTRRGLYLEAEQLLVETLAAVPPENMESQIKLRLSRAECVAALGKHAAAEEFFKQVLVDLEKRGDTGVDEYRRCLNHLAASYQATGRTDLATETLERCLQAEDDKLGTAFTILNEQQAFEWLNHSNRTLKMFLSIASGEQADAGLKARAFDWVLRRKGVLFDSLCQFRHQQILRGNDPEVQSLVTRLNQLRQHLATATIRPEKGLLKESQARQQDWLRDQIQRQEAALRRLLAEKIDESQESTREVANLELLRSQLSEHMALVEFVRVEPFDFQAVGNKSAWQPAHYYALVASAQQSADVQLIDLGVAAEIDGLVEEVREELAQGGRGSEADQEEAYQPVAQALYERLFLPLEKALGTATMIYLSPDSELNRIGFETLVDRDGKYLVERYLFAYLSSGRDLLRKPTTLARGTTIFANPDFFLKGAAAPATADNPAKVPDQAAEQATEQADPGPVEPNMVSRDARKRGWPPLEGTQGEADALQELLAGTSLAPVSVHLAVEAREETFKKIVPPRVLHIATHGYFFEDELASEEPVDPGILRGSSGVSTGYERLRRAENPLLRSGLVLAGANLIGATDNSELPPTPASITDSPASETATTEPRLTMRDDGWLTAQEISTLDLQGTDLVVLSACQTGLGDIRTGEGVQGLRRAFFYAGASTLVTSLYSVPDSSTRELMQAFYEGLIQGQSKAVALREAQLKMLKQRRADRQAAHPYYWGSFILVGPM